MLDPGPGEAHQDGESNEGDGGDGEEHRLVRGTQGQVVDRSLYLGHDIDEGDGGGGEGGGEGGGDGGGGEGGGDGGGGEGGGDGGGGEGGGEGGGGDGEWYQPLRCLM